MSNNEVEVPHLFDLQTTASAKFHDISGINRFARTV